MPRAWFTFSVAVHARPNGAEAPSPAWQRPGTGNFFEDFRIGQVIGTPRRAPSRKAMSRCITGLFGPRFAVQSSDAFARPIGYPRSPIDDLLVFHVMFGKTVPDVSLNAVANLGYAEGRFLAPVYPGDTSTRCRR